MTALFHFEDKVHRRHLTRAESTPLLFPRLLFQVLEHIGFLAESRLEHRRDLEAILMVDRWQIMPRSYHLPPPNLDEDQPATDFLAEEQPPSAVHTQELQVPTSLVPALLPTVLASSTPPEPVTWTLVRSIRQHCTLQCKKKYEIRVGPDLFRLVNVLGLGSSSIVGRVA